MVVRDINKHAEELGIDYRDYASACRKVDEAAFALAGKMDDERMVATLRTFSDAEVVALVRWERIDRRIADVFDWNGLKQAD